MNSLAIGIASRVTRSLENLLVPFSFVLVAAALTPIRLPADRWWTWAIGLIATDFCYYWGHRADHWVRIMWTAHSVHHSSEQFNLTTGIRMPVLMPFATFLHNEFLAMLTDIGEARGTRPLLRAVLGPPAAPLGIDLERAPAPNQSRQLSRRQL
ncbi:sterol desaturase family protein [Nocardia tengchongensis]